CPIAESYAEERSGAPEGGLSSHEDHLRAGRPRAIEKPTRCRSRSSGTSGRRRLHTPLGRLKATKRASTLVSADRSIAFRRKAAASDSHHISRTEVRQECVEGAAPEARFTNPHRPRPDRLSGPFQEINKKEDNHVQHQSPS